MDLNLAPHVDFEFCAAALVCYVVIYCYWQLAVNEKQRENWEVKTEKMGSDEETEVSEHETDHGQELSCFQWCYTRARGSMLCWLPPYEQVCWCQFSLVKIKCSYLQLQLKTSFQSKLPINEMFTINRKLNIWYQILQVQTQQTNDENNDDQNRCVISWIVRRMQFSFPVPTVSFVTRADKNWWSERDQNQNVPSAEK